MKSRGRFVKILLLSLSLAFAGGVASVQGSGDNGATIRPESLGGKARALRQLIIARVGSLDKLKVPASNNDLPQPMLGDGVTPDPRYQITEAKRYLGKLLFFDPVRTNRIRPEFGGVLATAQTGSCGSCHLGEVAGRAGQVINLNLGGEGRGFTDAAGVFHVRRRLQPGFQDVIPTGIQDIVNGIIEKDGRFDAVDSFPRLSPSMIGFGFNNRLLFGGKAGQPAGDPNNPQGLPAGENLAQLAFDVHRMLGTQQSAVQQSAVYVELFSQAFPVEAAQYTITGNLDDLINDDTIGRAIATFLRTVVTRNTAWDRFLAGDDRALTKSQIKGAKLFFTDASSGGANCVSCHSGPMLNKQLGDEEGKLVEENFYNLGIGDHPLQALARLALNDPGHHDMGRGEITLNPQDNFKFRVLTLRQLKDSGGQLTHSALFGSVKEVVEYFNAGVPQDPAALAAGNVTTRFTNPRGPNSPPGLGLSEKQVDELVDFLENGLYDPFFARFDPSSSTDSFELNARDLTYSVYRPDLSLLGAIDGLMPSSLCPSSNDGLTRRDRGLDFLDVTDKLSVNVHQSGTDQSNGTVTQVLTLTNISSDIVDTHLLLCFDSLSPGVQVTSAEGLTQTLPGPGLPYQRVFIPGGQIPPDQSTTVTIQFKGSASTAWAGAAAFRVRPDARGITVTPANGTGPSYTLHILSGQGRP